MMKYRSTLYRWTAVFLIFESLILLVPLIVLGQSINWPSSLDEPASVNLPLIMEQYRAMISGYSIYLLYSILFWPVAYLTGRVIVEEDTQHVLFKVANGFALLSTLARSLGIVRWLFTMPVLAKLYLAPDATAELKSSISMVYEMLNSYAGGVGELLGVNFFAAIWLLLVCLLILRKESWPHGLAYVGFLAATSLSLNMLAVIGVDMGPMPTISVVLLQLWMLAMALVFMRKS